MPRIILDTLSGASEMPWKPDEERLRLRVQAELQRVRVQEHERLASLYDWYGLSCPCGLPAGECRVHHRARVKQRPPDDPNGYFQPPDPEWRIWCMLAGRGGGKTASGSGYLNHAVDHQHVQEIVIVNATAGDVRDINVLGKSGVVATSPPWCKAVYIPSRAQVEWRTDNGKGEVISRAYLRSSEVPDGLRGLNASLVLADEPGKWINQAETWQQIRFILRNRVDPPPRCVITGTPTASELFYELQRRAGDYDRHGQEAECYRSKTFMVHWHTRDNASHLDEQSVAELVESLEGSLLGQQELAGVIIHRKAGALWGPDDIEKPGFRITEVPELEYIGVAVDPASGSKRPEAAETGIIIGGRRPPQRGSMVSRGVVLEDRTTSGKPGDWGKAVVRAYHDWEANEVIAEANQGGEMVRHVIQSVPAQGGYPSGANVPVVLVHASVGKTARAEPIQALDEAGRIQHMIGLEELERQMLQYLPGKAGQLLDRVDARVWLFKKCIIDHDSGGDSGPLFHGLAREPFQYLGDFDWSSH
jgi:phage terminase large subunit-like protein